MLVLAGLDQLVEGGDALHLLLPLPLLLGELGLGLLLVLKEPEEGLLLALQFLLHQRQLVRHPRHLLLELLALRGGSLLRGGQLRLHRLLLRVHLLGGGREGLERRLFLRLLLLQKGLLGVQSLQLPLKRRKLHRLFLGLGAQLGDLSAALAAEGVCLLHLRGERRELGVLGLLALLQGALLLLEHRNRGVKLLQLRVPLCLDLEEVALTLGALSLGRFLVLLQPVNLLECGTQLGPLHPQLQPSLLQQRLRPPQLPLQFVGIARNGRPDPTAQQQTTDA
mmetsp:Transcript_20688/g.41671  ORF Transcript_20688/g.41671 Transcript_20688/m.41671 type:complete len:280 (+) Transcript_20688:615-1454(+)